MRPIFCASRQAWSAPANTRSPMPSCALRRNASSTLSKVEDFDSPTGKGATGKVDGKTIALGNATS